MGKFTISMAIFNSKLLVYQRVNQTHQAPATRRSRRRGLAAVGAPRAALSAQSGGHIGRRCAGWGGPGGGLKKVAEFYGKWGLN